jgi:hypothetical protein
VEVGGRGPRGPAAFVEISPPVSVSGQFDDISRIVLMGDGGPDEPDCIAGNDGGWVCNMDVKDKMLGVSVYIRSAAAARAEELTRLVAMDVAENVVKKWCKSISGILCAAPGTAPPRPFR